MFGQSSFAAVPFAGLGNAPVVVAVTGLLIQLHVTACAVWADINNTQSANWATVNDTQTPNWTDVQNTQAAGWQEIIV